MTTNMPIDDYIYIYIYIYICIYMHALELFNQQKNFNHVKKRF